MIYLLGIMIGVLIVAGQALWKTGAEKAVQSSSHQSINFVELSKLLTSPYIILGVVLYGIATLCYMILLSKYEYTSLQSIVVSSSLTMTFIVAAIFFKEDISIINIGGLLLLAAGVILITKF